MAFFAQQGCTSNAANTKYNSRAALLYREKIKSLATQATRRNGTEVNHQQPQPVAGGKPGVASRASSKSIHEYLIHLLVLLFPD